MNVFTKITYGLYLVAVCDGGKDNGCIVNTALQQTSVPETVSVTMNKANLTTQMLLKSKKAAISILSTETPFEIFKGFGMRSGKDAEKFDGIDAFRTPNGALALKKYSVGYLNIDVIETFDLGTHVMFLGAVGESEVYDGEPVSYAYYHKNIKPKPAPAGNAEGYVCTVCGFIRQGKPEPGYVCPVCKHGAEVFEKIAAQAEENKKIDNTQKGDQKMAKFVCSVCGYVYEGDEAPEKCPLRCILPRNSF